MENFIVTTCSDTAKLLSESGLTLISNKNGMFTFINDPSIKFSSDFSGKISYTNKISF